MALLCMLVLLMRWIDQELIASERESFFGRLAVGFSRIHCDQGGFGSFCPCDA